MGNRKPESLGGPRDQRLDQRRGTEIGDNLRKEAELLFRDLRFLKASYIRP